MGYGHLHDSIATDAVFAFAQKKGTIEATRVSPRECAVFPSVNILRTRLHIFEHNTLKIHLLYM